MASRIDSIPWELIAPHENQALENHCGQDLEKLASRGGLCPLEAVAVIEGKRYHERWPRLPGDVRDFNARVREAETVLEKLLTRPAPG